LLVPGRKRHRRFVARRWFAVGALVLVALLYYRPLKAYVDANGQLAQRAQAVRKLQAEEALLKHRVASSTSIATLAREARNLGYVKPGEHLFIVKGINRWRKLQRASMMAHGGH
jgi:cell division protein FtsB